MNEKNTPELQVAELPQGRKLAPKVSAIAVTDRGVQLNSIDEMFRFAQAVINSQLAPSHFKTPEAVMIAMQHGMEIGLAPLQSLNSIAVINGRPSVWGDAALALVVSRPDFEDIAETIEGNKATCTIVRKGRSPVIRSFSEQDAKKAGLWGKSGPWTQYTSRMLQMRARSWAIRDAFPDALKGIQIAEEARDIPADRSATARQLRPAEGLVLPEEPSATISEDPAQVTKVPTTEELELLPDAPGF